MAFIAATAKRRFKTHGQGSFPEDAMFRTMTLGFSAAMAMAVSATAQAQVRTVDPNQASDLAAVPASEANYGTTVSAPAAATAAPAGEPAPAEGAPATPTDEALRVEGSPMPMSTRAQAVEAVEGGTYAQDDVLSAAEGTFGKGAQGLAKLIEKIFAEQGKPNAYIAGREAGGAIIVGVRYGSGTLFHKVEGQQPIYWTGPSLGFDLGANGAKSFVLVYNLYDSADLYHRFPAVEGTAYVIGGFTATYLRRGDVVLIPIRLGVGWRLGVNVGYMNFTKKSKILPF